MTKRSQMMMSGYILMPVHVCVLERVNACCGCVLCVLRGWKGWCVCLFLVQFTDSTQILSVYVGSRKWKSLRAEEVSQLRIGCLNSSVRLPASTSQQCMLYIFHFRCYSIKVMFYLSHLLICSLLYAALKRGYSTWIMKKKQTFRMSILSRR